MTRQGMLISITGPSGTGKNAVMDGLLAQDPILRKFVTATTRAPRPGEEDGKTYYFMTREKFEEDLRDNKFLEHNPNYNGNMYGTPRWEVERLFAEGFDIISDINVIGIKAFEKALPGHLFKILVLPPSRERLVQRLTLRNPAMAEEGRQRLNQIEADLDHLHNPTYVFTNPDMVGTTYVDYHAVLVNDVLDTTVQEAARLIASERIRRGLV